MSSGSNEPADAVRIRQLLDSMGVEAYEPRVVHQLLDFMYGYVSGVLQDAEAYSDRAGDAKSTVEAEDVLTAIQARAAFSFVQPPSQDILMALAEKRNAQPLPEIGKAHGLRLPPDDACLTAPTWQLPRPAQAQPQSGSGPGSGDKPGGSATQAAAGGASAMEVDGGGSAYQLPAAGAHSGGLKPRPPLDVHPGEATED